MAKMAFVAARAAADRLNSHRDVRFHDAVRSGRSPYASANCHGSLSIFVRLTAREQAPAITLHDHTFTHPVQKGPTSPTMMAGQCFAGQKGSPPSAIIGVHGLYVA